MPTSARPKGTRAPKFCKVSGSGAGGRTILNLGIVLPKPHMPTGKEVQKPCGFWRAFGYFSRAGKVPRRRHGPADSTTNLTQKYPHAAFAAWGGDISPSSSIFLPRSPRPRRRRRPPRSQAPAPAISDRWWPSARLWSWSAMCRCRRSKPWRWPRSRRLM